MKNKTLFYLYKSDFCSELWKIEESRGFFIRLAGRKRGWIESFWVFDAINNNYMRRNRKLIKEISEAEVALLI